jgi:cysteine synthase A
MRKPVENVLSLIGNTPIVKLKRISEDIPAEIWAKLEFYNPSGSVKDRIALRMLEEAEKRGEISEGALIVEPTSGNTGIGLALVCAIKGYQMLAVMPEAMSKERRMLLEYLGARVEVIPSCSDVEKGFTKEDIEKTLETAQNIVEETPNSYMPNQFENPDNPKVHAETTAAEILEQTEGKFDAFVAACGTGGTFSGVAGILKEKYPEIKRIVVEPSESAVMSGCEAGFHKIQGIGEGFIPCTMNTELVDEVIQVDDKEAFFVTRCLAKDEGILTGISGGANVFASHKMGERMKEGSIIVTIIPDNAFRYFSTELFQENGALEIPSAITAKIRK